MVTIVSGVCDPLMIAEVTLVVAQMILKKRFGMTPRISFDFPRTVEELHSDYGNVYLSILAQASRLMMDHSITITKFPPITNLSPQEKMPL